MSFDASAYLVCETPKIWVFDDLLSENLLTHIDNLFESTQLRAVNENTTNRRSQVLDIVIDKHTRELTEVICMVSNIEPIEQCQTVSISDVLGGSQNPHVDHMDVDSLAPRYQKLQFLDLSKQSAPPNSKAVVPTFSIVVYFNNVGSIVFPEACLPNGCIHGRRGRIIMFQNYVDSARPCHSPEAVHYGTYFDSVPKRIMTAGILSNETPSMFPCFPASGHRVKGLLYSAGTRSNGPHGHGHSQEELPTQKFHLGSTVSVMTSWANSPFASRLEAEVCEARLQGSAYTYSITFSHNLLNTYLGQAGLSQGRIEEAALERSCGNLCEEMISFLVLSDIGVHPIACAGWICACHLCTPLPCPKVGRPCACRFCANVEPQRKAIAMLWKRGLLCRRMKAHNESGIRHTSSQLGEEAAWTAASREDSKSISSNQQTGRQVIEMLPAEGGNPSSLDVRSTKMLPAGEGGCFEGIVPQELQLGGDVHGRWTVGQPESSESR